MALEVFISYAQQDKPLREELEKHLAILRRRQVITHWHEGEISPGTDTQEQIMEHLHTAQLILLLVSPDFIASDLCYSMQMQHAVSKHEQGQAHVIPILLRPVHYQGAPFAKLQPLPMNGIPITAWSSRDEALSEVVGKIESVITALFPDAHQAVFLSPARDKHLPLPRNPYFTGRQDVLTRLHETLTHTKHAALTQPQAISGLGGIGKTQTALEYAYRYSDDYQYLLWVKAQTQQELVGDLLALALRLKLPQQETQDQDSTLRAVKGWLETHTNWLLIFDNADDLALLRPYLPRSTRGQVPLTTRASTMSGIAQKVQMHTMEPEEGTLFLLRRAGMLAPETPLANASAADQTTARALVSEMDGLPLALDQAGAYIEETHCSLSRFLALYRRQRATILKRRGGMASDHPPVAATWSLSFQKVEQANPAAADVLRLCAFLAPDAIPEEFFSEGAAELGPQLEPVAADPLAWDLALKELLAYSLLTRDPRTETLTIHRLVQAILQDEMDEPTQRLWAERTIKATSRAFPYVEQDTRVRCERLLPHAQVCATLILESEFTFPEAARLLNQTAYFLEHFRVSYPEALPLYQRALAICEKVLGPEHPHTLIVRENTAALQRRMQPKQQREKQG